MRRRMRAGVLEDSQEENRELVMHRVRHMDSDAH